MNSAIKQPRIDRSFKLRRSAAGVSALLLLTLIPACGSGADNTGASRDAEVAGSCSDGKPKGTACPSAGDKPDPSNLIDDLEDQDGLIATVNGRSGGWWTAADDTQGASIVPERSDITDELATPEPIEGGRCGSKFAMHVTGQGFRDWGALLGLNLLFGPRPTGGDGPLPYDASAATGIEFWARIGDTSTNMVRFALSDINNEPDGGLCQLAGDLDKQCYDTFGSYLTDLQTAWKRYRIPYSALTQRGFGLPANGPATSSLFSVQFNFDPGAIFDFWVDDVAFY